VTHQPLFVSTKFVHKRADGDVLALRANGDVIALPAATPLPRPLDEYKCADAAVATGVLVLRPPSAARVARADERTPGGGRDLHLVVSFEHCKSAYSLGVEVLGS